MTSTSNTVPTEHSDRVAQTARLSQVLTWIVIVFFAAMLAELISGLVLNRFVIVLLGGLSFAAGCMAAFSLALVRRGHTSAAALTIGATSLFVALACAILAPTVTPGLVMVPMLAFALLLPYLSAQLTKVFAVLCVLMSVATYLLGTLLPPLLPPPEPEVALFFTTLMVCVTSGLTLLLLWQFSVRLVRVLAEARHANAALQALSAGLEQEVAARTESLSAALGEVEQRAEAQAALLAENESQRSAIRTMSVPVLPVSSSVIVIPLVGDLDGERLGLVQDQTLSAVERARARYVLLDITGVPVVDSHVAKGLLSVVQAAQLLGTQVVLVGVRPEVAQAIVTLGIDLGTVPTRQSLQEGIAYTLMAGR